MRTRGASAPPLVDVVGAAVLLAGAEVEFLGAEAAERRTALVLLAPLFTLPLAWRRRAPLATLGLVAVALATVGGVDPQGDYLSWFAPLVVACYSVAAYAGRTRAVVGLGLVLGFFAAGTVLDNVREPGSRPLGDLAYMGVLNTTTWSLGRIVRSWRQQARALEQRTAELEQEREWRAKAAVAEERTRIARELHDVIAHSVSVMVVQAAAAEHVLAVAPERAREPIVNIQDTGRQAVLELRRLLGILRPGDEEAALAPQPTLRGLGSLAQHARDAGLAVEVRIDGTPRDLPPGVELAAYRVVQEGLTNALKHAGSTAAADVVVRYGDDRLDVDVVDRGRPASAVRPAGTGTGHGLLGMRERVALYGGRLHAGPCEGGGFAVRASFPLDGAAP